MIPPAWQKLEDMQGGLGIRARSAMILITSRILGVTEELQNSDDPHITSRKDRRNSESLTRPPEFEASPLGGACGICGVWSGSSGGWQLQLQMQSAVAAGGWQLQLSDVCFL